MFRPTIGTRPMPWLRTGLSADSIRHRLGRRTLARLCLRLGARENLGEGPASGRGHNGELAFYRDWRRGHDLDRDGSHGRPDPRWLQMRARAVGQAVLPTPTRPVRPQSFRQRRRHVRMDRRTPDISTRRGNTAIRGGQPRTVNRRRRMRREPNRLDPHRPGRNRAGRRRPIRSLLIRRQPIRRRPNRAAVAAPAPGPNAIARSCRTC